MNITEQKRIERNELRKAQLERKEFLKTLENELSENRSLYSSMKGDPYEVDSSQVPFYIEGYLNNLETVFKFEVVSRVLCVDSSNWEHFANHCKFEMGGRIQFFDYLQGTAHKLNPLRFEVVGCICTDACYYLDYRLDDFLTELGYTEDIISVRKGERAYSACQESCRKLKELGLTEESIRYVGQVYSQY